MASQDHPEELPLKTCRRILGPAGVGLSDAQLEQLRAEMYALARCATEVFLRDSAPEPEASVLALVPAEDRDGVEERAAVLQFDAKMTRGAATRTALGSYVRSSTLKAEGGDPRGAR